jgi:hypothetical protein
MSDKDKTAAELLDALGAFLDGTGHELTVPAAVEKAIRLAEHRAWSSEMEAKIECRKAELEVHRLNIEMMHSWHGARLDTEKRRQGAADAEAYYWNQRARFLGGGQ